MGTAARKLILPPERELIVPARFGAERVQGARIITFPRRLRRHSASKQRGFILNPYAHGGVETDADFASVVMLLHCDGTHGAQTCTDSSSYARTMTFSGANPLNDTGVAGYFGASSIKNAPTAGYISTADAAELTIGASEFCIEGRTYWPGGSNPGSTSYMLGHSATGANTDTSFGIGITTGGKLYTGCFTGATEKAVTSSTSFTGTAGWRSWAFCRVGNTGYQFLGGVSEGTVDLTGVTVNNSTGTLALFRLGSFSNTAFYFGSGNLEEIRITIGAGRYSANYTPRSTPFPNS